MENCEVNQTVRRIMNNLDKIALEEARLRSRIAKLEAALREIKTFAPANMSAKSAEYVFMVADQALN